MSPNLLQTPSGRSAVDLRNLSNDATLEEVIFAYNSLVKQYNFFNKALSFQSNFDGYLANVEFASGESKQIPHFLGVIPKFRLVLRQEGNGVLSDIPSSWNDRFIVLKNNGAETVTATILIVRE